MQIISRFINYRLQKILIEDICEAKIPHRIKKDGSIQTAEKWKKDIFELCVDQLMKLFEQPALWNLIDNDKYPKYISNLAKHNIPFYVFVINGQYTIATSNTDSQYICDHIKINLDMPL